MKALVTGSGGMMGSHLIEFLHNKGIDTLGTYYNPTTDIKEIEEKAKLIECDVRDKEKLKNIIKDFKPDLIFHLAAQSYPTVSLEKPNYTIETNIIGTINLFESLKELNLNPKVLVACSSAEYGYVSEDEVPVKEDHSLRPLHPYGVSKVGAELISYQYFKNFNLKPICVRIFNTTGPRKVNDVCADFTKRAIEVEKGLSDKIKVGSLEKKRGITDVRDLIEAFWLAMEKAEIGETYNLSGSKVYEIKELLDIILKNIDAEPKIEKDSKLVRAEDEPIIFGDSSKFVEKTGWKQKIPIEKTIKDMLDYWRGKIGS